MRFSESLKKYGDFQRVYKKGKSYANKYLIMYVMEQDTQRNRIGISVSKKVGNSVVRHRLTRLIRESYRLNEEKFVDGLDIVIIARPGAKGRNFFDIESAMLHLGRLQKIMRSCQETEAKTETKTEKEIETKIEVKKEDEKNTDLSD